MNLALYSTINFHIFSTVLHANVIMSLQVVHHQEVSFPGTCVLCKLYEIVPHTKKCAFMYMYSEFNLVLTRLGIQNNTCLVHLCKENLY